MLSSLFRTVMTQRKFDAIDQTRVICFKPGPDPSTLEKPRAGDLCKR